MIRSRYAHSATLLPGGKVLVTGGYGADGCGVLRPSEIYDPVTNHWSEAPPMATGRAGHTATLLPNGKVLVAGGTACGPSATSPNQPTKTSELYDPASNVWLPAPNMAVARSGHFALLLRSGRMLVVGGTTESPRTVDVYDPTSNSWTTIGQMSTPRPAGPVAFQVSTGKVYVVGGANTGSIASNQTVDVYDPTIGTWPQEFAYADNGGGRLNPNVVTLDDGRVLVINGLLSTGAGQGLVSTDLFDPASDRWSHGPATASAHCNATATLINQGRAFVAGGRCGGSSSGSAEIFIPAANAWTTTAGMLHSRAMHTATLLSDGRVLVTGGLEGDSPAVGISDTEIYAP